VLQNGGKRTWFMGSMIRWELVTATTTHNVDGGAA
jgi:hypothetical protein